MPEKWLPVVDFEGLYEVSDAGRVRSTDTFLYIPESARNKAHYRYRKGRILRTTPSGSGPYPTVFLWKGHKGRRYPLHVLVLTAFAGPRPPGHHGCHDNGVGTDNRRSNLYWGTPTQNAADKRRHGTHIQGEGISWAKLTEVDVLAIRATAGSATQRELANIYGVQQSQISRIINRKEWAHL